MGILFFICLVWGVVDVEMGELLWELNLSVKCDIVSMMKIMIVFVILNWLE